MVWEATNFKRINFTSVPGGPWIIYPNRNQSDHLTSPNWDLRKIPLRLYPLSLTRGWSFLPRLTNTLHCLFTRTFRQTAARHTNATRRRLARPFTQHRAPSPRQLPVQMFHNSNASTDTSICDNSCTRLDLPPPLQPLQTLWPTISLPAHRISLSRLPNTILPPNRYCRT